MRINSLTQAKKRTFPTPSRDSPTNSLTSPSLYLSPTSPHHCHIHPPLSSHLPRSPSMAPFSTKLPAVLSLLILSLRLSSADIPTISASPAVLPYLESPPGISSFFPSTRPWSSAASPAGAFAPVPSSGEFVGKSCSGSVEFSAGVAVFGLGLCFLSAGLAYAAWAWRLSQAAKIFVLLLNHVMVDMLML